MFDLSASHRAIHRLAHAIQSALASGREAWAGWQAGLVRTEPLPHRPAVVAAVCLAAGCVAGRGLPMAGGGSTAVAWWWLSVAMLAAWWWSPLIRSRGGGLALWAAIVCAGAAWSAARFDLFRRDEFAWHLAAEPAPVAITGTVVESFRRLPVPTGDATRAAAIGPSSECVVAVDGFRAGSGWRPVSGRAAVVVDGEPPDVGVGSRVRVLGRGLRPAPAFNPEEFDFALRARAERCLSIVRVPAARCIQVLVPASFLSPAATIDALRARGVAVLEAHISPARAALAAALLLGSREALPREDADEFLVTGTVHILSISGLHVGLLALVLFKLLRVGLVPRAWSLVAVAAVTGGYMLLVRAETPVLRATLLVWLSCLAAALGRRSPAINALAIAAIVVLVWRPAEVFSAGAQLSFLSTAVLVGVAALLPRATVATDPIDRLIERSRSPLERIARGLAWQTWTLFLTGAAVWVATSPLVAARFHIVSPVGLVVNVLVAPLVALAMAWGFLCLVFSTVSTTLAAVCGVACDAVLAAIAVIVAWAATIPGGHRWLPGPPEWWVAGWYVVLVVITTRLAPVLLRSPTPWAVAVGGWVALGLTATALSGWWAADRTATRVVVAAMGHGCGIVVRSPAGKCLVYDAGRLGAPGAARRAMAAVLWSEGVSRIDSLVISHADTDHFNAVPELLERFVVGELVATRAFLASPSPAVADVVERVRRRGIPVRTVAAGDAFALDRACRARVLHPAADAAPGHGDREADNETSIVLAIESAGRRVLLTGDLEGRALAGFVAADPDSCDVLVAPHHGSRTSLPPDIARATAPAVVLVSGVGGSGWSEVREAYRRAAGDLPATVLKTGGEGAIRLAFDAEAVDVERYAAGRWGPATKADVAEPPTGVRPDAREVASARGPPR
jgi:competence protein ComEC